MRYQEKIIAFASARFPFSIGQLLLLIFRSLVVQNLAGFPAVEIRLSITDVSLLCQRREEMLEKPIRIHVQRRFVPPLWKSSCPTGHTLQTGIVQFDFDISPTEVLTRNAGDWPGMNLTQLLRDYADPLDFIENNRP